MAVLDEVAVTVPKAFATVTFALPFTGTCTDVGDTLSAGRTVTDTGRLLKLSAMVTVAEPAVLP